MGVSEDAADSAQNSSFSRLQRAKCPRQYFGEGYRATELSGPGPRLCLALPPPPTGSTIKGLSCSAPLTRGLKSRGDHELHQHPAAGEDLGLGGGGWAVLWTPRDRLSRTRESGSCFVWPEEV